jgi:hypothetical protein
MDSFTLTYFPQNKILYAEKDQEWRHSCVDGVISICYTYGRTRRQTSRNKRRNYNLFNNKIDKADFDYVLNPFNLSKEKLKEFNFPASLQPYDIISPYFHLLLGEESKRLFQPIVFAINEESSNEKQEIKKKEILAVLEMILQGENPQQGQNTQQQQDVPELLKKYQNYTPKMIRESISQKLFEHYRRKERIDQTFNLCFKDALVAGEEAISVEKVGDGVQVRRVNPLELWYQLRNNSEILDDAEKIYERNQMTVSEITDEFYEYLTPEQIDELESWGQGANSLYNFGDQQFSIPEVDSIYAFEDSWNQRGIPVHRVRWQSKKKVGIHHFTDPNTNLEVEEPVEETFKINKEDKSAWIEWFWINEYWEGVRIGQDMYIDPLIRPRKQQFRTIDNLSECKSGYFGTVYSAINSQSVSLMDRLVPWIYMYLIVWYRTELAMAKNIGKIGLIPIELIPDQWEPEKWMYYAQAMGFGWTDRFSESKRKLGPQLAGMNQGQALDLSQWEYINGHLSILKFIEERIENTAGITRQRLGEISSSELVGNTERAVVQSSHVTEPYFAPHDFFKIRVCEAIIEVAKECLEGKEKNFQYITDDLSAVLFAVQGDDFINADYGIFCSNSTKDSQKLESLRNLLQSALQNDKVQLSQVANIISSDNFADIKQGLIEAEKETQEQLSMQEKQKNDLAIKLNQDKIDLEKDKMDREDMNKQLDRENSIETATIKSQGVAELKQGEKGLKELELQEKMALERSKLDHDKAVKSKELSLEQQKIQAESERTKQELEKTHKHEKELQAKELASKEKIARQKPKTKAK